MTYGPSTRKKEEVWGGGDGGRNTSGRLRTESVSQTLKGINVEVVKSRAQHPGRKKRKCECNDQVSLLLVGFRFAGPAGRRAPPGQGRREMQSNKAFHPKGD